MNINQLLGRLTREPEIKETKSGKLLMTFTLAYDTRRVSDNNGSHANFIMVECWEKLAERFAGKLVKGMQVLIKGELVQNRWKDLEGKNRTTPRLVASSLVISDLKRRPPVDEVAA